MSRSGYHDCDGDQWTLIRWRGAVSSAINGKRGQAFLKEMLQALDEMPVKELYSGELEIDGRYCALGVLGKKRGLDLGAIDPQDSTTVAGKFGIADALAREIVWVNDDEDDSSRSMSPHQRYEYVRRWIISQIRGDLK